MLHCCSVVHSWACYCTVNLWWALQTITFSVLRLAWVVGFIINCRSWSYFYSFIIVCAYHSRNCYVRFYDVDNTLIPCCLSTYQYIRVSSYSLVIHASLIEHLKIWTGWNLDIRRKVLPKPIPQTDKRGCHNWVA